ncbi:DUF2486 family protein [Massilia horti]|uniref:DUF2486 family protein n=1 Tax=Massilia horti TaxID=2562153 RepID=A0A4Y9SLJ0_9BURK|nr:DUF2486 family protein [Massilia horti]TFW27535.1 DUF2486 family protein [Massilia horti]
MSQDTFDDASIPVLTEVVDEAPQPAPAALAAPEPLPEPVTPALAATPAEKLEGAIDSWDDQDWDLLERRLSERILQQLQGRVDFVLEQRLRDSMSEVLQHAVNGLTTEIRDGLQQTIEKIVVRAVSQELAHLQTLKK